MSDYVPIEGSDEYSIYLAGGWFTDTQMECMTKVYQFLVSCGFEVNSPFYTGIVVTKDNDSPQIRDDAFWWNVDKVIDSDIVVAVIDDFDAGTMIEMGMRFGVEQGIAVGEDGYVPAPHIISYSDVLGRGLNLMLQRISWAFANGLDELYEQLSRNIKGEAPLDVLPYEKGDVV